MQLEIERLEQRAQRLQASGEVTEKAAAEFVDQKVNEVVYLQKELGSQVAGEPFTPRKFKWASTKALIVVHLYVKYMFSV